MTKVKLPREVAEAIDYMKEAGCCNYTIFYNAERLGTTSRDEIIRNWAFRSNEGSPDLLMQALVVGYEIEMTPEERVREYYEGLAGTAQKARVNGGNCGGFSYEEMHRSAYAITVTLDLLGIEIVGVNA